MSEKPESDEFEDEEPDEPVVGETDVDLAPFQLVADAFMLGRRRTVEPFEDDT